MSVRAINTTTTKKSWTCRYQVMAPAAKTMPSNAPDRSTARQTEPRRHDRANNSSAVERPDRKNVEKQDVRIRPAQSPQQAADVPAAGIAERIHEQER